MKTIVALALGIALASGIVGTIKQSFNEAIGRIEKSLKIS